MANPKITDYRPANGSPSLPLNQTSGIWVQFDQLMDEDELDGNLFLEGPDTDQYIGPGLIELATPDNISQGEVDDFLRSPGYHGIVDGITTFETVSGCTKIIFSPSRALAPSVEYTAHLLGTYDLEVSGVWTTVSGVIWNFETGTGSIQELPSNLSSSVLADLAEHGYLGLPSTEVLEVVSATPADHSINNPVDLDEIVVTFSKPLDPLSITADSVFVETLPVTDHPSAAATAQGEIITSLEVSGVQLKIKL